MAELRLRILKGDFSGTGIRPEQVPAIDAWLTRQENNRAAMMQTWALTQAIQSANRFNNYNYPGSWINPIYVAPTRYY
jgi:hypothetical protein